MGWMQGGQPSSLSLSELMDLVIAETNRIATEHVMNWISLHVPEDMYRGLRAARGVKSSQGAHTTMVDAHKANWDTGDHYTSQFRADGADHAEYVKDYIGVNWTKPTVSDKYEERFREWWQSNIEQWADYARRLVMGA